MLKESLKLQREREKERMKGGKRKEYKIKITKKIESVKKEGNFPANIYTAHQINTTAKCKCIYKEITREEYHNCRRKK